MRLARLALVLALALLSVTGGARVGAHALDPGYLELSALSDGEWRVTWRSPQVQGRPMGIAPRLPEGCTPATGPEPVPDGRGFLARWVVSCPAGLEGGVLAIDGLEATRTDVLVRYQPAPDAAARTERLTPDRAAFTVPERQGPLAVAGSYFRLGFDHILEGWDHLLFVFALLLLVRVPRRVVGAVTAFTVAHSLTLAAAALGALVVPPAVVEALIALSIAALAVEIVRAAHAPEGLSERYPAIVAFAFGLLHGLGFARALTEIGLPESDVVPALLAFNIGVEAGQLTFVAAFFAAGAVATRLRPGAVALVAPGAAPRRLAGYAIGTVAAFWTVERVAGFWI